MNSELPCPKAGVAMEEQIDEILRRFDFDNVHKCMVFLQWKWANHNLLNCAEEESVPKKIQLIRAARRLLREAAQNGGNYASGGFSATLDGDNCLTLEFILASWDGFSSYDETTHFEPHPNYENHTKKNTKN